ncbi:hypothetical protein C2G38_2027186 [Gigaspora rosea]|uniref:Uncharacterized protein n=1 Tax=Gigaspora rosea TaxID=44941 RepID=A0A397W7N8_9GLOM|nr:hypothetical protein C2G38_2027186 [Gigaspora rosea]
MIDVRFHEFDWLPVRHTLPWAFSSINSILNDIQTDMSSYKKEKASERECIFAGLVETYKNVGLSFCGEGKWRNANGPLAAKKIKLYHIYLPGLANLCLDTHSICSKHYDQIVINNQFYEYLVGSAQENQTPCLDTSEDNLSDNIIGPMVKLEEIKQYLDHLKLENQQKSQEITELNSQVERMQQYIDGQKNEIEELKSKLRRAYDSMDKIQGLYDEQSKHNEDLLEQWRSRFSDQHKRINAVIEIAKAERASLFDDIESLIRNNARFSIENIMMYSPREWLNRRNQVIVKFIETLVLNVRDDSLGQEKLFKAATAVDLICGARHGKYVSEVQLALSAIKYLIARSRMIVNIDNHITNLVSEYRFQKWLEELSKHEEPLPEGLLFLAFDNEQRGQKNYLDRGFNTVIYHVVTSFVGFNMAPLNKIQHTNSPWAFSSLDRLPYEELFNVSPQMQKVVDDELYSYLTDILNLLSEEKLSSTNAIDSLIASIGTNITHMKMCLSCNRRNIQNRKKTCPECGMKLPTLAEIQQEKVIEDNITNKITQPLIFKPYSTSNEPNITNIPRISFTQQVTDPRVNVPEIYIPDPLNINPNSITNVEKVLSHIEIISGIKSGIREWVAVVCDGVPYHHAIKLKEKFPRLVLILGQLHEEMNMLRAFVELNW